MWRFTKPVQLSWKAILNQKEVILSDERKSNEKCYFNQFKTAIQTVYLQGHVCVRVRVFVYNEFIQKTS